MILLELLPHKSAWRGNEVPSERNVDSQGKDLRGEVQRIIKATVLRTQIRDSEGVSVRRSQDCRI